MEEDGGGDCGIDSRGMVVKMDGGCSSGGMREEVKGDSGNDNNGGSCGGGDRGCSGVRIVVVVKLDRL